MKNIVSLILSSLCLVCCCGKYGYTPGLKDALYELDRTIEDKSIYEAEKETRISEIKNSLPYVKDEEGHYDILDRLYGEYYQYNIDSAIFYANTKLQLALAELGQDRVNDAILDVADRYMLSGMYAETLEILENVNPDELSWMLLPQYLHIRHSVFHGMRMACDDPELRERYQEYEREYRRRLHDILGDEDISKLCVNLEMKLDSCTVDESEVRKTMKTMLEKYSSDRTGQHSKAIIGYSLANAYSTLAQKDSAMLWYARSAVMDLTTPVHEYKSLYELATLLYGSGDIERAYRYITCSIKDAMTANARINIQSINESLPIISESYDIQMHRKRKQLGTALLCISILLALLAAVVGIILRDRRKLAVSKQETENALQELKVLASQLEKNVKDLAEANRIKEAYLARYIDLCSDYIGRLDKYRSHLNRMAKVSIDDVRKELKSTTVIDQELEEFYQQFDATFLDLFPDFVEQLNSLLQPDKRIKLKTTETGSILTTELRIFALIRIGVQDSVKIAAFLRRSASTIYNYRVKIRNAALDNREDLEKQIMELA